MTRRNLVRRQLLTDLPDECAYSTYIPQEEGMRTVCQAYEEFYHTNPPIPTRFLREMLCLVLQENSFQFNGKYYLQTHGTAMGTKLAVAFANIFMAKLEKEILRQSEDKPLVWKKFIDDVFSLWNISAGKIEEFIRKTNSFHYITFLDTKVYKGNRFHKESILEVQTYYKPTENFQHTNFYSCHPPGVTKGFLKGEALRLLRTNSSHLTFEENTKNFERRLKNRGYPANIVEKHLSNSQTEKHHKKKETRMHVRKYYHL